MKKFLIGLLMFIILLFAAAVFLPYIFKDQIIETIKEEANKNLNASIDFDNDISLNIFRSFPDLHLGVKNISLLSRDSAFSNDTILYCSKVELRLDLIKLYKDQLYILRSLKLKEPQLRMEVNKEGAINWDIFLESEEESSEFELNFDLISVEDGYFSYMDFESDIQCWVLGLNHSSEGEYSSDSMRLAAKTTVDKFSLSYEDIPYFYEHHLVQEGSFLIDWGLEQYSLPSNSFILNGLPINLDAGFAFIGEDMEFDIKALSSSNNVNEFLSLIPAIYSTEFEGMESSGKAALEFMFKGLYSDTSFPGYSLSLSLDEGRIKYPDMPLPATDLYFDFSLICPDGETEHQEINLSKCHFNLDGEPFDLRLSARDLYTDPLIDLQAIGLINFDKLSKIIPTGEGVQLSGSLLADIEMKGRTSAMTTADLNGFEARGDLSTKGLIIKSSEMNDALKIESARFEISNQKLEIPSFSGSIGQNDLLVNGTLDGFFAYMLSKGILNGDLSLQSRHLNLNDFMSEDEPDSSQNTNILLEVPANLDFRFNASVAELIFNQISMSDFVGTLAVKNRILSIEELNTSILGGNLNMSGSYSTTDARPKANLDLNYSQISAGKLAKQFDFLNKLVPFMNEIKSNSNASMKFAADLKEDMSPDLSTLDMSGSLVLDQISLQNFQTIKNIEQQLGTQKLSNQVIQDLLLQFEIAQGKILVKPFQFVKDSILLQLQGASMLDGSIDYTGLLSLPASYVSREKQLVQSYVKTTKWSDYLPKMGDYLNMDMAITGTFKKPKVQLLLNKVVENYQSQLKETLMGQINQQKKQTEDKAKEELKSLTDDAQKKTEEKKEEIKQELEQKKEEAEEQVKKEAEEKSDALKKEAEKKLKDIWKPR